MLAYQFSSKKINVRDVISIHLSGGCCRRIAPISCVAFCGRPPFCVRHHAPFNYEDRQCDEEIAEVFERIYFCQIETKTHIKVSFDTLTA
jgi:hypothetical protein